MRVALFTDTFLPQINGVTNTLTKMLKWFSEAGIEYMIFAPDYGEPDATGYSVIRYPSFRFFLYPECRLAVPNTRSIHEAITAFHPDVILNMTEFNMGMAGISVASKYGIPAVSNYTTHFPQYLDYYKADWLKPTAWQYIRYFHNRHQLTLCPSHNAQNHLTEQGIRNTAIFSRGIDTNRFSPEKRSESLRESMGITHCTSALYVGRLSAEKDLDILNVAWTRIVEKFGNAVRLVIAGDGPMMPQYKKIFPESTIFTGFIKGEALSALYASCNFFVFPSSTETFGNVVLEAMASGLPVIGADGGGVGEIIQNKVNGLSFEPRNTELLEAAICEILANKETTKNLSQKGLETAHARTWEAEFAKLYSLFEWAAKSRSILEKTG